MEIPKISIIIPVYNAELYLHNCIESVLEQTLEDFELILIDDGSKDRSLQIIDYYMAKDSRIRVKSVENGGPAKARNIGVKMSQGQYVGFVDADDCIEKNMLQKLYDGIIKYDADIIICNYAIVDKGGNVVRKSEHGLKAGLYCEQTIKNEILFKFYTDRYTTLPSLWNKLYKKEMLDKYNILIPEYLIRAEDFWFNFEVLMQVKKVNIINDVLYQYQQINENSIMHQYRSTQLEEWKNNREKLLEYNKMFLFELDYNLFYKNYLHNVSVYIIQTIKSKARRKEIIKILKEPFYNHAVQYSEYLPKHVRVINWFVTKKHYYMACFLYWCWYEISKI